MAKMVNCVVLGKQAEGLERSPYPGELGQRILENVSGVIDKREASKDLVVDNLIIG